MNRLFVARLWFEGNRFSRAVTGAAAFERREFRTGPAALAGLEQTATELAAVIDFARTHRDWSVVISRCASAEPGGPIDQAWFDRFVAETVGDLAAADPTHVFLSLHGAAITTESDTPELDWLRALRRVAADVAFAASFDLHGNIDPALPSLLDFATAYRCHPHTDMRETAARALSRLAASPAAGPRGERGPAVRRARLGCRGHVAKLGKLVPSFNMRTSAGPMAELEAMARAAERRAGVVDVSVFGGFPYADSPTADGSILVWVDAGDMADDDAADGDATSDVAANGPRDRAQRLATTVATELLDAMAQRLPRFAPDLPSAADGLAEADRLIAAGAGLVAVTDPGDNPLSGGEATTTGLLRALLAARGWDGGRDRADSKASALPTISRLEADRIAFAYFANAALVERAREANVGATIEAVFGAEASDRFGEPIALTARVVALTAGRFANSGAMERGRRVDCGQTAVLEALGIRIVVTSALCPANDPAFFALHGIDLDRTRVLCVKAKNHFRAAFTERCAAIIDVDCPGPAAADLRLLPFRNWPAAR